ncbi:MAG: helix-turn-helix transcriptional regulator [Candidatus Heimdallarchaeaceae archaeon]
MRILQNKKNKILVIFTFTVFCLMFAYNIVGKPTKDENAMLYSYQNMLIVRYHDIRVDISSVDEILCKESFIIENFENSSLDTIPLWFNYSISSLKIKDINGSLLYNWKVVETNSNFVEVYLRKNITLHEIASFSVEYELLKDIPLIPAEKNYYLFEFYTSITYSTSVLNVEFSLPENSFIHQSDESIYPNNGVQKINYNRITVSWQSNNVSAFSNPLFYAKFDEPITVEEKQGFFEKALNLFLSGLLLGFFLGISFLSWFAKYKEKRAKKQLGLTLLDENQKELIKIVYEHNGKISQKEMCTVTGFSKSKISRNLIPLEKRGLIYREKWGRTYVIHLTKEGKTVIE